MKQIIEFQTILGDKLNKQKQYEKLQENLLSPKRLQKATRQIANKKFFT